MKKLYTFITIILVVMSNKLYSQSANVSSVYIDGLENELVYEENGKGDVTILLIHGLGSSSKAFSKLLPLIEDDFKVISFDLPGYGRNKDAGSLTGMESYAGLIKELIEDENWQNVILAGHSMGGQIALKLATMYYDLDWLKGLYLIAPAGIETFSEKDRQWFYTYTTPEVMMMLSDDQIKRNFDINFAGGKLPDDALFMYEDRMSMKSDSTVYRNYLNTVNANIKSMLNEPVYEKIGSIRVPVTLVFGRQDYLIPNKILHPEMDLEFLKQDLEKTAPSVSFELIEGGGHFLVWDKPAEVAHGLKMFVKNLNIKQH